MIILTPNGERSAGTVGADPFAGRSGSISSLTVIAGRRERLKTWRATMVKPVNYGGLPAVGVMKGSRFRMLIEESQYLLRSVDARRGPAIRAIRDRLVAGPGPGVAAVLDDVGDDCGVAGAV